MTDESDSGLLRIPRTSYGDSYQQHFLEQYKLYVESADRISQRRVSANNYLLTVNSFLVTLYGLAASFGPLQAQGWLYVLPVAGVLVSLTWALLIKSYKDLNTAKYKVIHELEEHLPVAVFDREWVLAERGRGKAYKPLTHVERWIPIIFLVLYVVLGIYSLALPFLESCSTA